MKKTKSVILNQITIVLLFAMLIFSCKNHSHNSTKKSDDEHAWIYKEIGSFIIEVPQDYSIEYYDEQLTSGVLGNKSLQMKFGTGYSPIYFENRIEETKISLDTNDNVITRVTKFKLDSTLTFALEAWDTSRTTGKIFENVRVDGIAFFASDLSKNQIDTLLKIFKSIRSKSKQTNK